MVWYGIGDVKSVYRNFIWPIFVVLGAKKKKHDETLSVWIARVRSQNTMEWKSAATAGGLDLFIVV